MADANEGRLRQCFSTPCDDNQEAHRTQNRPTSGKRPASLRKSERLHISRNHTFPGPVYLLFFCNSPRPDSSRYRSACEGLILHDFEFSVGKDIESKLWDSHGQINNLFRKELKHVCPAILSWRARVESDAHTVHRSCRQKEAC